MLLGHCVQKQGSPIGVGVVSPTPWGRSEKFTKLAKSRLFQIFFANLIQNGLNDTKMEFISM